MQAKITTKKQSSATTTSTSSFNQKSFVNGLMDVMPQAVINSSFTPLQPVRKVVRKLPVSLTMLKNSKYTAMTKDELKTACEECRCRVSWQFVTWSIVTSFVGLRLAFTLTELFSIHLSF